MGIEIELAAARFVSSRSIGDLDVPDAINVGGHDRGEVVPVDCQVVEVGQQPEVLCIDRVLDAVDDADDVCRGEERLARRTADRFDEDNGVDARR